MTDHWYRRLGSVWEAKCNHCERLIRVKSGPEVEVIRLITAEGWNIDVAASRLICPQCLEQGFVINKIPYVPPVPIVRPVGANTCNALVTEAPLTNAELDLLRLHFAGLEQMLVNSGPRFSNARQAAVEFHNRAVRRLLGIRAEIKRREAMQEDENLLEIR